MRGSTGGKHGAELSSIVQFLFSPISLFLLRFKLFPFLFLFISRDDRDAFKLITMLVLEEEKMNPIAKTDV